LEYLKQKIDTSRQDSIQNPSQPTERKHNGSLNNTLTLQTGDTSPGHSTLRPRKDFLRKNRAQ